MGAGCSTGGAPSTNSNHNKETKQTNSRAASATEIQPIKQDQNNQPDIKKSEDSANHKDPPPVDAAPAPTKPETPPLPLKEPTPPPPASPKPEAPEITGLDQLSSGVRDLICGRVNSHQGALDNKVITVWHIALTDSIVERAALLEKVYGDVQSRCQEAGCELRVVDLVSSTPPLDNSLRHLSKQLLKKLLERDKHVIVTVFLNEKYGECGCPGRVEAADFDPVLSKVTGSDKELLSKWYTLDEHCVPPTYRLQPINAHIAKYGDMVGSEDEQDAAMQQWLETQGSISGVLHQAADPSFEKKYLISSLEEELEEAVFSSKVGMENVIWVHRTFSGLDIDLHYNSLWKYIDLTPEGLFDDTANTKFKNLTNRLTDKVDPSNKVDIQLEWSGYDMVSRAMEHEGYLTKLVPKYAEILRDVVERVIVEKSKYDATRVKVVGKGIPKSLYDELEHQDKFCCSFMHEAALPETLASYILHGNTSGEEGRAVAPLVVHGAEGSGKSSVAAWVANRAAYLEGWTRSVAIVRSLGASPACRTLEQVIASINEHLANLTQTHISYAHKSIHQDTKTFQYLLEKIPESVPTLVVIDGLEQRSHKSMTFEWLPKQLPSHIRILLTTTDDCDIYNTLKTYLGDESFIGLPDLPNNHSYFVKNTLDMYDRTLTAELRKELEDMAQAKDNILLTRVMAICASLWPPGEKQDGTNLKETLVDQINQLLEQLESNLGVDFIKSSLTVMTETRYGVSDLELEDIISFDDTLDSVCKHTYAEADLHRIPQHLWATTKYILEPLLQEIVIDGMALTSWKHHCLSQCVRDRYGENYCSKIQNLILNYFEENLWSDEKAVSEMGEEKEVTKKRVVKTQKVRIKEMYNRRRFDEHPWMLLKQEELGRLEEQYLLNASNFCAKLSVSGVYNALEDITLLLDQESGNRDMKLLHSIIQICQRVLANHEDHFAYLLDIIVKSGKVEIDERYNPSVKKFFEQIQEKNSTFLESSLLSGIMKLDEDATSTTTSDITIGTLERVRGAPHHMVSADPSLGEVALWDIHKQEKVRTIAGLKEPKKALMVNTEEAVVLCGRELSVVNLDEGTLVSKLKGVLNLKMPFFAVQDEDHIIALSRNRMYVNVINKATGDMEATFKVGEDRFLNSLLVSSNGMRCVCGDEVQKPFPLLVWDLSARKLIYDLRMAGHEFLTNMSAITDDGHYAISVCRTLQDQQSSSDEEHNFLIVYDLMSGALFKKWKPDFNTTSVAISSRASVAISGQEDGAVLVWDLIGGTLKYSLRGHKRGPDRICVNDAGSHCVTYDSTNQDTSIFLWDIQNGECVGSCVTELGVTCCQISADGSCVVIGSPLCRELIKLSPQNAEPSDAETSVYGDASRMGHTFDLSDP